MPHQLDWLNDILPNRDRFPDTVEWTINEAGDTVTLGQLRTYYGRLQSSQQALLQEKAALDRQFVDRLSREPNPRGSDQPEPLRFDYGADPVLGDFWKDHESLKTTVVTRFHTVEKTLQDLQALTQHIAQGISQFPVVLKTQQLQAKDPALNTTQVFERATDLARKATVPGALLDDAYTLLTLEQQLAAARAEGERVGREAAEREYTNAPFTPNGPAGVLLPIEPPKFEHPAHLSQAILNDMDIQRIWAGHITELPRTA